MRKAFILIVIFFAFYQISTAQNWQSLSTGLGGFATDARTLYADTVDNVLYVGGTFTIAGGLPAWGIARWDGFSWDSLGSSLRPCCGGNISDPITTIIRYKGDLYAGGSFDSIGGVYSNSIARWDGTNWNALGEGVKLYSDTSMPPPIFNNHGAVSDMVIFENELYVFGCFDTAGGIVVDDIAKWDGTSWASVATGLDCYSGPGAIYKDTLYVGSNYDSSFGFDNIGRWDGATWQSMGGGLFGSFTIAGPFAIYLDTLYVGGYFTKADGNPGNMIAKWDGSTWYDVGGGMNGQVNALTVFDGNLYAGGVFTSAGGVPADKVAKWNGTEWCGLGSTFSNNAVLDMTVWNNELYIAGAFTIIDGDTLTHIAKWTGGNFTDTCGVLIGIEEETKINDKELNIYPNPTTGRITVTGLPAEPVRITVYNVLGELVYDQELNGSGETVIDLSALADGLYYLRILGETISLSIVKYR